MWPIAVPPIRFNQSSQQVLLTGLPVMTLYFQWTPECAAFGPHVISTPPANAVSLVHLTTAQWRTQCRWRLALRSYILTGQSSHSAETEACLCCSETSVQYTSTIFGSRSLCSITVHWAW